MSFVLVISPVDRQNSSETNGANGVHLLHRDMSRWCTWVLPGFIPWIGPAVVLADPNSRLYLRVDDKLYSLTWLKNMRENAENCASKSPSKILTQGTSLTSKMPRSNQVPCRTHWAPEGLQLEWDPWQISISRKTSTGATEHERPPEIEINQQLRWHNFKCLQLWFTLW